MNKKQFLTVVVLAGLVAFISGLAGAKYFISSQKSMAMQLKGGVQASTTPVVNHRNQRVLAAPNFVEASKKATPSVVFIKTESQVQRRSMGWFFFDPFGSIGKVSSSGSGVILSSDGYIVTNYHVIKGADKIEVVLNKQKSSYKAQVVGTDPSSDLALIKIEAKNLQAIEVGDSENIEIGNWVLAVGNPFNLTSTVTAGIVSAKGRNINIVENNFPIESFIQTDAAINPGNSGGALVDLEGSLVGVNTAIASETGSYVGYGFAIPVNIVTKIVRDLKEFGQIQRGITGFEIIDLNAELSQKLNTNSGVYVTAVNEHLPDVAKKIDKGDLIKAVDGKLVDAKARYDEILALHRPGDKVVLTVVRNGKELETEITLVNKEGNTKLIKRESVTSSVLGADFDLLSKFEMERYGETFGVKASNIHNGLLKKMNIREGFIFTSLNGKTFSTLGGFIDYFENLEGNLRIEGISPEGSKVYYNFRLY